MPEIAARLTRVWVTRILRELLREARLDTWAVVDATVPLEQADRDVVRVTVTLEIER